MFSTDGSIIFASAAPHCGARAGWNGYRNKCQHKKLTLEKKSVSRRSCWNSKPRPSDHESGTLPLSYQHHHLSLNREDRWGTTDDFATSFLHFSPFSTALWDLPNSRPVHSLMLSFHLFLRLPFLPPSTVPCKMVLARADESDLNEPFTYISHNVDIAI